MKGFSSSRSMSQKYTLIYTLHKGIDGALLGVLISATVMSTLALHSQHLWSVGFSKLERTREFNNKLEESTAILERHYLQSMTRPKLMVATKSSDLLYIEKPTSYKNFNRKKNFIRVYLSKISRHPILNGY